jgi:hypothetical protein
LTEKDFSSLYETDVDFKELVGYVKALAKVNSFFAELASIKFDKLEVDGVKAIDIQVVLDMMYKKKVQGFLEEKATASILKYADKLLRKETNGIQ